MLIQYALINRKVNHLMLWIYFKHIASGHLVYSSQNLKAWAVDINMSERWVKEAVKWLIKKGWVTVNTKKETYRVISYKQLCNKLKIRSTSAVIYEPDDFSEFKNYCCAVVITYYLKLKILTDKKNQSVSNLDDSSMSWHFYSKGFHAMPTSYIAKCLDLSNSTANNYKKCAISTGKLQVKKHLRPIIDSLGKKLGKEHLNSYKATFPNMAGRVRTDGKYLKIVDSDLMKSEIKTKRKRYKHNEKK
jgi:hypothetical protein